MQPKKSDGPLSFKDRGFSFVPVQRSHINLIGCALNREPPEFERVAGYTMVDAEFLPVGFAFAYFEDNDVVSIHAYFGDWLRTYPKDILRQFKVFFDQLRSEGHMVIHAIADEDIRGSIDLVRWMGGEKTGDRHETPPVGDVYKIDLTKTRI